MPLEDSCEKYKGELVFVLPVIGFGWSQRLPSTPRLQSGDSIEPPMPFHAKLMEFHYFNETIKAGIGIVEEKDHPLDKEWVAFCIRDRGDDIYNLTTNPGYYNICIGKNKPVIKIDPENLAMPEWMQFEGSPFLSGLGYITESPTSLEEIYERIKRVQKS